MANILIFNWILPYPPGLNGNTIRVFPLSRELAKRHACYLVAFGKEDEIPRQLKESGVYKEISLVSPPSGQRSWFRHLHLLNGDQARIALPLEYRRIVKILEKLVAEWRIDLVICHTAGLAEYVEPLIKVPKVLDAIDCNTLAGERRWQREKGTVRWNKAIKSRLAIRRKRYLESRLSDIADVITVVSPVDRDYLRGLCLDAGELIVDIPNGVSSAILDYQYEQTDDDSEGIAFWGALDFPPNKTAIHYFYDEIFLPFLAEKDIRWFIIGKNPSRKMEEMAERHRNIRLTGYVDDLCGVVSRIPLMVNPMQMGGGLKNKVLEAFALKRLVVSNTLGMEAIPSARSGTHYIHAETPSEFADAIVRYSSDRSTRRLIGNAAKALVREQYMWETIGNRYLDLLDSLLHSKTGGGVDSFNN